MPRTGFRASTSRLQYLLGPEEFHHRHYGFFSDVNVCVSLRLKIPSGQSMPTLSARGGRGDLLYHIYILTFQPTDSWASTVHVDFISYHHLVKVQK